MPHKCSVRAFFLAQLSRAMVCVRVYVRVLITTYNYHAGTVRFSRVPSDAQRQRFVGFAGIGCTL